MGDADELLFVTEGDDAMPVLSPIAPEALKRDTLTLTSSSKKMRLSASLPRFGMNLRVRLARRLCGIMIPHRGPIDRGSARLGGLRSRREQLISRIDVTRTLRMARWKPG